MLIADLNEIVAKALIDAGLPSSQIQQITPLSGGSINAAWRVDTAQGNYFLKTNAHLHSTVFAREADGLIAIERVGILRVPHPLTWGPGEGESPAYLLTELVETGTRPYDFFENFGQQFAEFHRRAVATRFGFDHDNYIGSTPQPNTWNSDWVEFFREQRLGYQLQLAEHNGYTGQLQRLGHNLQERLDSLLDNTNELPTLLHGDLWSGNFLCSSEGQPVVIDPAVYYGHREADLAMMILYGNLPRLFFSAYEESHPLQEDWRIRVDIYKLYHLLNHLNLFGNSYLTPTMDILRRYA